MEEDRNLKKVVALEYALAFATLMTAGLTFYKVYLAYQKTK